MYKRYIYRDIEPKNVYVCGDSHGSWGLLRRKIQDSGLRNAIIIIAGDCGVGFERPAHYTNIYNTLYPHLKNANIKILCVRGNHDDPSYYEGEKINEEFLKTIPDYSVITVGNIEYENNILCVGGATSIDRIPRMEKDQLEKRYNPTRPLRYWVNEIPIYKPDILDEIKNDGVNISTVITHTSPKFAPLSVKTNLEYWILNDKKLDKDIDYEREVLTLIYEHLINKNAYNVKIWAYGHFHQHDSYISNEGVKFKMLDMMRERDISWDICPIEE